MCIWCNERGRTFYSLDAVRKHMTDKGHCKMLHEGLALAEYAEFYDYSSSYPDNVSHLSRKKSNLSRKFVFIRKSGKFVFNSPIFSPENLLIGRINICRQNQICSRFFIHQRKVVVCFNTSRVLELLEILS